MKLDQNFLLGSPQIGHNKKETFFQYVGLLYSMNSTKAAISGQKTDKLGEEKTGTTEADIEQVCWSTPIIFQSYVNY